MQQTQERSSRLLALGFVSLDTQLRVAHALLSLLSGPAPWAATPTLGLECKTLAAFSSLYSSAYRQSRPHSPSPSISASWFLN